MLLKRDLVWEIEYFGGGLGICPEDGATKLTDKLHLISQAEFTNKLEGVHTEEEVKVFLWEVAKLAETQIQQLEMAKALMKNV